MRVREFIEKLKAVNPRFRFVPGSRKQSGLYKKDPGHPDAHEENGFRWVAAIPSPSWFFGNLPDKDFYDKEGEYHRGLRKIVNLLYAHGELTKSKASYVYGSNRWLMP